jgi:hypothetical protein
LRSNAEGILGPSSQLEIGSVLLHCGTFTMKQPVLLQGRFLPVLWLRQMLVWLMSLPLNLPHPTR